MHSDIIVTMQELSIFTKIINGQIPGEIVYRDDICVALLTHEPITPGHLMIIPVKQVDKLWDLDDETYHHLFDIAKVMAARIDAAYDYKRVGLIVEGFGVPHAHIHVLGYAQPLEPTIAEHIVQKRIYSAEELKVVADKINSV